MKLKRGAYKEIGKHFLSIALVSLTIGLITPLFREETYRPNSMIVGFLAWLVLFLIGVYFLNRGEWNG